MRLIQDSREQRPIVFTGEYITDIIVEALPVGDYACEFKHGYRPPVYFERKSIGDLFSTLGSGYARFKRELERADKLDIKLILIIEGSIGKVYKGTRHSSIKGSSIVKKLFTLWIKYNLLPVFCKDREELGQFIVEYYSAIGRKAVLDVKKGRVTK